MRWDKHHPARKLLHNEIFSGRIPLEESEMGPAQVHYTYSSTLEFQMKDVEYGSKFINRLRGLRQQIRKQSEPPVEKGEDWNEHHPARKLLYDELVDGRIPVDYKKMGPAEVFFTYAGTTEFQMNGMSYDATFRSRLLALRNIVKREMQRAKKDKNALRIALKNYPPPANDHHGRPQWNGSVAQILLKLDVANGKHRQMKPHELRTLPFRQEHMLHSVDEFRWKLQQEIRTQKYLYTLKYRAEEKLRETMERDGIGCCDNDATFGRQQTVSKD